MTASLASPIAPKQIVIVPVAPKPEQEALVCVCG